MINDGLCEPVTCSKCGAVGVNGGVLYCNGCYCKATNEGIKKGLDMAIEIVKKEEVYFSTSPAFKRMIKHLKAAKGKE